jgi:methyl-accepting chemotaxis protein
LTCEPPGHSTQRNAALVEESAAATESLSQQAEHPAEAVRAYRGEATAR